MSPHPRAREIVYLRSPAPGRLARYVEDVWVQESPPDDGPSPATVLVPGPSAELIVSWGDPFERIEDDGSLELPSVHVVGLRTRSMRVRATGRTGMVIVRLHPWMLGCLTGGDPGALVDRHLDLGKVTRKSDLASIVDRVHGAGRPESRIRLVATWLEGLLDERAPDRLVTAAVGRINESAGGKPVGDLARELDISSRQLRRRFREAVGLPPKRFSRLVRFQKAVGLLRRGHRWDRVLERCDFFDQAHLIGELSGMAGVTPRTVRERRPTPLSRYFNRRDIRGLHGIVYF